MYAQAWLGAGRAKRVDDSRVAEAYSYATINAASLFDILAIAPREAHRSPRSP